MNYLLKRMGLIVYGLLSTVESVGNTLIYLCHLDVFRKPFDFAMPFYFWYTNKFLKKTYVANLKNQHGQDI